MEHSEKIRKAFFALLRAGLWNRELDDVSCFPLSDFEWGIIWMQAKKQSVRGLIYDGICLLPEKVMPDSSLVIGWTVDVDCIERRNRHMNGVLQTIVKQFDANQPHPVVLKGQGVAQFYEHPLLRECGDIDLYFANRQDEQFLLEWIQSKGISIIKDPDDSCSYVLDGIDVEHHHRVIDLYAWNIQKYVLHFLQKEGYAKISVDDETDLSFFILSPAANFLLLNTHLLKHIMGHGIGLRQFCDLARAYHVLRSKYNGDELKKCYQRCGLLKWSRLLHTMLVKDIGLCSDELPYKEKLLPSAAFLLDKVILTGNFGKFTSKRAFQNQAVWKRKIHTGLTFVGNLRFSLTYAPTEVLGLVCNLFWGNIKA